MNDKKTNKTGYWILEIHDRQSDKGMSGYFYKRYVCSHCRRWQTYGQTAYCPHCGFPMKTEELKDCHNCRHKDREDVRECRKCLDAGNFPLWEGENDDEIQA